MSRQCAENSATAADYRRLSSLKKLSNWSDTSGPTLKCAENSAMAADYRRLSSLTNLVIGQIRLDQH